MPSTDIFTIVDNYITYCNATVCTVRVSTHRQLGVGGLLGGDWRATGVQTKVISIDARGILAW